MRKSITPSNQVTRKVLQESTNGCNRQYIHYIFRVELQQSSTHLVPVCMYIFGCAVADEKIEWLHHEQ